MTPQKWSHCLTLSLKYCDVIHHIFPITSHTHTDTHKHSLCLWEINTSVIIRLWKVEGYTGVERWGWTPGSGSFHSFLPMLPLASPTSSQRLKEARYRQDNNRLIRGYIESRLELKRYKPETLVHTLIYTHGSSKRCGHTVGRCHYGAPWHT